MSVCPAQNVNKKFGYSGKTWMKGQLGSKVQLLKSSEQELQNYKGCRNLTVVCESVLVILIGP